MFDSTFLVPSQYLKHLFLLEQLVLVAALPHSPLLWRVWQVYFHERTAGDAEDSQIFYQRDAHLLTVPYVEVLFVPLGNRGIPDRRR